ncbi:MAG: hypothetical protein J0M11_18420 [Anaerolineae bacterium]|nr:hypothetical protein [Anaerolineae bacterium]
MSQFLEVFAKSQILVTILTVWILLCLANQSAREALFNRLATLISKPNIFSEDMEPKSYPFYPRKLLEYSSHEFRQFLSTPIRNIIEQFQQWISLQVNLLYNQNRPIRMVGYLIYFFLFVLFVWAAAISTFNSLSLLSLFEEIPTFLNRFEIAVIMGSLGSAAVAGLVLMEIQSKSSVLSNWEDHEGSWKVTGKALAISLLILSVLATGALGLQTFLRLNREELAFEITRDLWTITNFAFYFIVPINNVLSTILIAYEAILGILVVLVAIQVLVFGSMYLLSFISTIIGALLPFTIDILFRLVFLLFDLLFYLLVTPIDLIISIFKSLLHQRQ